MAPREEIIDEVDAGGDEPAEVSQEALSRAKPLLDKLQAIASDEGCAVEDLVAAADSGENNEGDPEGGADEGEEGGSGSDKVALYVAKLKAKQGNAAD
jgi:hypothetical protein